MFISEEESAALASHEMAFHAMQEALAVACEAGTANFPVVLGHGSSKQNRFTVKAAATAEFAGLKVGSYWPGNLDRGFPRHNSMILLFDQGSGRLTVAMEAGKLNAYRTAAADAVAANVLARKDAATLVIFGSGHQAATECAALARIRPLQRVLIVARNRARGSAMAASIGEKGLDARVEEAQAACAAADLVAIGEVLAGRHPGRQSDREITIFDSSGLSVQDLYVAWHVLAARQVSQRPDKAG